jgi:hypothetical protein
MKPFRLSSMFRILQTGYGRSALVLTALAGLWGFLLASMAEEEPEGKMAKAMEHQKAIYVMLAAWAQDHDATFPDEPLDANANFRVLFQKRLMDNEKIFGIPGDGWCQEGKPDGEIGDAPDFSKALEPGELSIAYVAGHDGASSSLSPLMISGAGAATAWIMGVGPKPAGAVFRGPVVVTFVNGSTQLRIPDEEGKICWQRGDRKLDIFSAENGIKPENIRLPAPVKPKD